jgi:GTP pyrophosphokinase
MINFGKAIEFCELKHRGQTRKNGAPYLVHPMRVAAILLEYKGHSQHIDEITAACLLHDIFEDTDTTLKEIQDIFGTLVAGLVLELTSNTNEVKRLGKTEYLSDKIVRMSPYARSIKLGDRLDNVSDLWEYNTEKRLSKVSNTLEILEYVEQHCKELNSTQKNLIKAIKDKCDDYL